MRFKQIHVENRVEYAREVIGALSAVYRSGSVVNGNSHMAVFDMRNKQITVRAKTRPELMGKLDAFIEGAYAAQS